MVNHLYYGDNLPVLRESVADASVDLVYLDPPFNSNASYNVLFMGPGGTDSPAQIEAFDDTWHWTDTAEAAYGEVLQSGNRDAAELLRAMRVFLGENDMMAYLAMMTIRLLELHRVLKDTGSLYLHCDPTAAHYLKLLMDAVFGCAMCQACIAWKRTYARSDKMFGALSDTLLWYGKGEKVTRNMDAVIIPFTTDEIREKYPYEDERGRYMRGNLMGPSTSGETVGESGQAWKGCDPTRYGRHWSAPKTGRYARYLHDVLLPGYLDESGVHARLDLLDAAGMIHWTQTGVPLLKRYCIPGQGVVPGNIWTDIPPLGIIAKERLGYPTQKPVALLERIIAASSNEGDLVLDPFCGCGTTVHAAEKLNRRWCGIDITHLAIGLIEKRLRDAFPRVAFTTHGVPQDIAGARDLARRGRKEGRHYFEFEKWALSLINARPGTL